MCKRMSQKFWNILACTNFQYVYHMTEAFQAMVGTHYGW